MSALRRAQAFFPSGTGPVLIPFLDFALFAWYIDSMRNIMKNWMIPVLCGCILPVLWGKDAAPDPSDPLRAKAESGDVRAQFHLGNEYFSGTPGRHRDLTLAAYWFLAASDRGLPEATFNYAICLDRGWGVDRDPYLAAEFYRRASEKGTIPQAAFNYAMILKKGIQLSPEEREKWARKKHLEIETDEKKASEILRQLAEKGFAPAKTEVAESLLAANPMPPGYARRAFLLLSEAAADPAASPKTFRLLADCWYGGIGTEPDDEKMIASLQTASDRGDTAGTLKLAWCLENGLKTAPDAARAFVLYRKTAEAGLSLGQYKVAQAIEQGKYRDPQGVDAVEWYSRAAMQELPQACLRLGEMAENGEGRVPKNPKMAMNLYLCAAKKGYARAQYRLGMIYLRRDSEAPGGYDPSAAFYWFRQGAQGGDTLCMRALARCLLEGTGCDKNRGEGILWLRRAAENGDILAEEYLKELH